MKKIEITYSADVIRKGDKKVLRRAGQVVPLDAERALALIAIMESTTVGGNTQTTNPLYPREMGIDLVSPIERESMSGEDAAALQKSRKTSLERSFVMACSRIADGGSKDDVYRYYLDGVCYRETTRGNLVELLRICNQIDGLKREAVGLVTILAPFPAKEKGVKKSKPETDESDDDVLY